MTSVLVAMELAALPAEQRRTLLRLVTEAFNAGWDQAVACAKDDRRTGTSWLDVWESRDASCWAFLEEDSEALTLLALDNPVDYDEMRTLREQRIVSNG